MVSFPSLFYLWILLQATRVLSMQEYGGTTEQQNAVGAWLCDYAESRQPFDGIKHRHTLKEVGDVAEGKYDWKIKNGQGIGI